MKTSTLIIISFVIIGVIAIALFSSFTTSRNTQTYRSNASSDIVQEEGQLVEAFPDFPEYPGALLEESSQRQQAINTNQDIRAAWQTSDPVPTVMSWYVTELPKNGWTVEPPDDPMAQGEQVAQLSKDDLRGYIGIENEGTNKTEIVVDFRKVKP